MKKLYRCPICGSKCEDLVIVIFCVNPNCQNYRKDKEPIISDEEEKKQDDGGYWTFYNNNEDDS